MLVEFRELKWALIAAQHRSLRRAAENLIIRQLTLSRRLRDLELQLGALLFERTHGGTKPTTAGQEFLDVAHRILQETDAITIRLQMRSPDDWYPRIGDRRKSRAALIEHRSRCPNVETCIVDGSGDHLLCSLVDSEVDIAFVAEGKARRDDKFLSVWSERVGIALQENHPLSSRDCVYWDDLSGETLLSLIDKSLLHPPWRGRSRGMIRT